MHAVHDTLSTELHTLCHTHCSCMSRGSIWQQKSRSSGPEAWSEEPGAFHILAGFHRPSRVQPREKGSNVMTPVLGKEQSHCGQRGVTMTRGVANAERRWAPLCPFLCAEGEEGMVNSQQVCPRGGEKPGERLDRGWDLAFHLSSYMPHEAQSPLNHPFSSKKPSVSSASSTDSFWLYSVSLPGSHCWMTPGGPGPSPVGFPEHYLPPLGSLVPRRASMRVEILDTSISRNTRWLHVLILCWATKAHNRGGCGFQG